MTLYHENLISDCTANQIEELCRLLTEAAASAGFDRRHCTITLAHDMQPRLSANFGDQFNWNETRFAYDLSDLTVWVYAPLEDDLTIGKFLDEHISAIHRLTRSTREASHLAWRIKSIGGSADSYSPALAAAFKGAWDDAMVRSGLKALLPPAIPSDQTADMPFSA